MPTIQTTYPGLYIEELASGSRAIVGAPTAITAFVGRAPRGKVDEPTDCFTYGDFERYFGGLHYDYPMSYAVQDFFQNGGMQATICRAFKPAAGQTDETSSAGFPVGGGAPLIAASPGTWGNNLQISFDYLGLQNRTATPATAAIVIGVPDKTQINGNETVTVTLVQPAPTTDAPNTNPPGTITVSYYPAPGDDADAIASGLKAAFENQRAQSYQSASVSPPADGKTATITFNTVATGTGSNFGTATGSLAGGSSEITFTPTTAVNFAGAKPTYAIPAELDVLFGGNADTNIATFAVVFQNGANGPTAEVRFTVPENQTPAQVATAFAAAVNSEVGGGIVGSAAVDQNNTALVRIYAGALGSIGNSLTAVGTAPATSTLTMAFQPPSGTPSTAITKTPSAPVAFTNGTDNGFTTTNLAQSVATQYAEYGIQPADLFNISVQLVKGTTVMAAERILSVTIVGDKSPTRIDRALKQNSELLRAVTDDANHPSSEWTKYGAQYLYQNDDPKTQQWYGAVPGSGVDSQPLTDPADFVGDQNLRTGMYSLEHVPIFNLLCIPPDGRADTPGADVPIGVWVTAADYCASRKAMVIVDPPVAWADAAKQGNYTGFDPSVFEMTEDGERHAAVYFPRIVELDPMMNNLPDTFAACGAIAGQYASTDTAVGVWKAPAGIDNVLGGVQKLEVNMTDPQNGLINPLGINALRTFPIIGNVIWGARTLRGADMLADDYKYVPARRLTNYIELSLLQNLKWAVFEPNDEVLWSQLRMEVGAFMGALALQGAFYGYKVLCDNKTTTPLDIQNGVCNIVVAFAPVLPAEYIVIQIQQQTAAQLSS